MNNAKVKLSFSDTSYFSNPGDKMLAIVSRQSKSMNESEVGLLIRRRAASSRRVINIVVT